MNRWQVYRLPSFFCAVAALELARAQLSPPEAVARADRAADHAIEARYPDLPRSTYHRGLRALQARDYLGARQSFETALGARYYTDESLLHNYALLLIHLREPKPTIDRAAELWRKHFPQSRNPDPRRYEPPDRGPVMAVAQGE
ncbi:MAG: hypothetical protein IPK00_10650 [Deltaproteobacteria bacterium]|nr:hypothetical protein [Deltaproteobacteria bacterium]